MIYGNLKEDIEYKCLEEQVLQEMHFSKKDLQDPKTLEKIKKILDKKQKFSSLAKISVVINFILYALLIAVTYGAAALLVLPYGALVIVIYEWIRCFPISNFKKNSEKFERKVKELKEKTQEKLNNSNNPKEKAELQEILNNLQKVEKAIFEKKAEEAKIYRDKENKKALEEIESAYKKSVKWLEEPNTFSKYFEDLVMVLKLLKILNISDKIILDKLALIDKNCNIHDRYYFDDVLYEYKIIVEDEITNIYYQFENNINDSISQIGEFKNKNSNEYIILLAYNDYSSYHAFYSKKDRSIYVLSPDTLDNKYGSGIKKYSIDEFIYTYSKVHLIKWNIELVKEIDKELGYYVLSDAPEGLETKKLPI